MNHQPQLDRGIINHNQRDKSCKTVKVGNYCELNWLEAEEVGHQSESEIDVNTTCGQLRNQKEVGCDRCGETALTQAVNVKKQHSLNQLM